MSILHISTPPTHPPTPGPIVALLKKGGVGLTIKKLELFSVMFLLSVRNKHDNSLASKIVSGLVQSKWKSLISRELLAKPVKLVCLRHSVS